MHIRRRSIKVVRVALLGMALMALAACSNLTGPNADAGGITAQASGKFSGGSLSFGSVDGFFTAVGLGSAKNEDFEIQMTVNAVVWFSCVNNGGNVAPGQFDYNGLTSVNIEADIDENGRYVTPEGKPVKVELLPEDEPTNQDCRRPKNWTVVSDASGDPITYMQPKFVTVNLVNIQGGTSSIADTLKYDCGSLPDPTYPLESYVGPTALTAEGYCKLL